MPNWCNNNLTVIGDKIQINEFFEKAKSENSILTFNNVYPRPKSLDITCGSSVSQAAAYIKYIETGESKYFEEMLNYWWCQEEKIDSVEKVVEKVKSKLTQKDLDEGRISIDNLRKYGYTDWYHWNCDNWGTKWDACEVFLIKKDEDIIQYTFDTAWAPPIQFLLNVSRIYPGLEFQCDWGGPEMDGEGRTDIQNGTVIYENYVEHNDEYYEELYGEDWDK